MIFFDCLTLFGRNGVAVAIFPHFSVAPRQCNLQSWRGQPQNAFNQKHFVVQTQKTVPIIHLCVEKYVILQCHT